MPKISAEQRASRAAAILDAAWACFARQGLHRTTMAEIADEAGLTAGALYRYFDSKEAVVIAFATRELATISTELDRIAADPRPELALAAFVRASFGSEAAPSLRPSHTLAIELWAEVGRDPALARKLRPIHRKTLAKIEEVVRALPAARTMDEARVQATARMLRSLHLGLLVQLVLEPSFGAANYAEAVAAMVERIAE